MENKKFNQFENQNGFEDFGTISLEYLNEEAKFIKERQNIEAERGRELNENREAMLDIYNKNKESGRENNDLISSQVENDALEQSFYSEKYGARFDEYNSRDNFIHRQNLGKTQKQLREEINTIKSQINVIPFSKKLDTLSQAIGLKKVA